MNAKLPILIGVLVIAAVALIGPAAAATSGTTVVFGNPKASVSITLNQSSVYLDLDPTTSPATNSSLAITVSTNAPFTITVKDNTGRGAGAGSMGNYTTSYVANPLDTKLASALGLSGTTNTTTTAQAIVPPITVGSTLYTGNSKVTNQVLATLFSQAVAYDDPRLPGSNIYRIDLEFDITAT